MLLFATYLKSLKSSHPAWLAFFASLVLSFIAIQFEVTLSRDAAFYLDIAQSFNEQGLRGLFKQFNWPWFLLLLAISHNLTGLALETLAYLWVSLFMALCCTLWVDMLVRRIPGSAGWALLVVLAMPAFNQFRGDIIREHGFWCFSTLALWLALRWEERGGWKLAWLAQVSVVLAALFRLEAIVLMPALVFWRLIQVRSQGGWLRLIQITWLPVLTGIAGLIILATMDKQFIARIAFYLSQANPQNIWIKFNHVSDYLANILEKWSKDDSGKILFFGLLATLIWTFIHLLGTFILPFLLSNPITPIRLYWQRFQPVVLAFIFYFAVLMVFFIQILFINGRYTSFLNMLALPLVTFSLMVVGERLPRMIKPLLFIFVCTMLVNVISLSPKKTHYIEAANWLKEQELPAEASEAFYFEDGRIGYYAGWGYTMPGLSLKRALSQQYLEHFRYWVFEAKSDEPWLLTWFKQNPDYKILAQFTNGKKTVLIIGNCGENPVAGCEALSAP